MLFQYAYVIYCYCLSRLGLHFFHFHFHFLRVVVQGTCVCLLLFVFFLSTLVCFYYRLAGHLPYKGSANTFTHESGLLIKMCIIVSMFVVHTDSLNGHQIIGNSGGGGGGGELKVSLGTTYTLKHSAQVFASVLWSLFNVPFSFCSVLNCSLTPHTLSPLWTLSLISPAVFIPFFTLVSIDTRNSREVFTYTTHTLQLLCTNYQVGVAVAVKAFLCTLHPFPNCQPVCLPIDFDPNLWTAMCLSVFRCFSLPECNLFSEWSGVGASWEYDSFRN